MSSSPIEIAVRLSVIRAWMDVAKFAALKEAVDMKQGRLS